MASISNNEHGSLTISVKGLRNTNGQLGIALFTSEHGFPDNYEHAFTTSVKKINTADEEVILQNIPYGTYAVSVLHDDNCNGKMEKTFFGIPKKGFGVSNNPEIMFGPPSFEESVFALDTKNIDLTITMVYL